jgi:hypothetical protein
MSTPTDGHYSYIYNNQKHETTQISIDIYMDKQIMAYQFDAILCSDTNNKFLTYTI